MADQVNPLGGLAPGMAQVLHSLAAAPSQPKPAPARASDSRPKVAESRSDAADSKAPSAQEPGGRASKPSLDVAAKSVEEFLLQSPSDLRFMVDKETGISYFKIVDPVSKETILQVPAEEILEMAKRLRALSDSKDASGVLMDAEG